MNRTDVKIKPRFKSEDVSQQPIQKRSFKRSASTKIFNAPEQEI